jgi:hypothetical protein
MVKWVAAALCMASAVAFIACASLPLPWQDSVGASLGIFTDDLMMLLMIFFLLTGAITALAWPMVTRAHR